MLCIRDLRIRRHAHLLSPCLGNGLLYQSGLLTVDGVTGSAEVKLSRQRFSRLRTALVGSRTVGELAESGLDTGMSSLEHHGRGFNGGSDDRAGCDRPRVRRIRTFLVV